MPLPKGIEEGTFPPYFLRRAEEILDLARDRAASIACAESCTGGLITSCLSEIPGASDVLVCGFVVYSNEAKRKLLGVSGALLENAGAVSKDVAVSMAINALERSGADFAVATTGIAGPGGGSREKPVGLVHFACARKGFASAHREKRFDEISRCRIRLQSVSEALAMLREALLQEL